MQLNKKTLKILIPIVAIVLVIAIAAIVILPRPNLEIKDINSPAPKGAGYFLCSIVITTHESRCYGS